MPAFCEKPLSALPSTSCLVYEEAAHRNPREERTDFEELRGYGGSRIYRHGQDTLAVSTETRMYTRLSLIPGLAPKTGSVLPFPDALLDTVAEAIRARYWHTYTMEQLEAQRDRMREARKCLVQDNLRALETTIPPGDEDLHGGRSVPTQERFWGQ